MLNRISGIHSKEHYFAGAVPTQQDPAQVFDQEPNVTNKRISVRAGNSVLWRYSDLDLLPQKEEMRHRHFTAARSGHDKQVRPRQQSKKYDYMP